MEKVKVSTDGTIDFKTDQSIPTTAKRFRQSQEIEAFYRFVMENDLREEGLAILSVIQEEREALRLLEKEEKKKERQLARKQAKEQVKQEQQQAKSSKKKTKKAATKTTKKKTAKKK
jgi:hypothetical protein